MPGVRGFATLEAALAAQQEMIKTHTKDTRIVITAYQDKFRDSQFVPFLIPGSESEYDLQKLKAGMHNLPSLGNMAVFDYVTVFQNQDCSILFYETMDFGHTRNPNLIVKHKDQLYPPGKAATIYMVTPIKDHPRAPLSPFGSK